MISLIAGLIQLAFWLVALALAVGLLCGFAVLIWKSGCALFTFGHEFVLAMGEQVGAKAMEVLRVRYPSIFPQDEERAKEARLRSEISSLQYALATAQGRAAGLSNLVDDLRRQLQAGGAGPHDALFRSVGLHPSAPDFLLFAARREFRRRLHPDTHPSARRTEFTRKFQDSEEAFAQIWACADWISHRLAEAGARRPSHIGAGLGRSTALLARLRAMTAPSRTG